MKHFLKSAVSFLFPIIFFFFSVFLAGASEQVLLKNARIHTMGEQGILENSMILIMDGKVAKVGPDLSAPSSAKVVDLGGKTVIPGMVCASSALLLEKRDLRYSGEEGPDTNVLEGLNYYDPHIPQILKRGVTTVYVSPVSFRSIGGLGAVVKVYSRERGNIRVLKEKAALNLRLERLQEKKTSNVLRLTQYNRIRDLFVQAQEYRKEWADYEKKRKKHEDEEQEQGEKEKEKSDETPGQETPPGKKPKEPQKPKKDESKEVLIQAMDKKIPVRFIAHRPDAILQVLRLGEEFGLDVILERGEEWPQLFDQLQEAHTPLLSNPMLDYRSFMIPGGARGYAAAHLQVQESDLFYSDEESIVGQRPQPGEWEKLIRSGIGFALIPPDRFPYSAGAMREYAAYLSSFGVLAEAALAAVTSGAAEILGVSERVGSIEEGKDADLVVLDGEPLDTMSKVEKVFVDGVLVWEQK